jgi:hypothetical protein
MLVRIAVLLLPLLGVATNTSAQKSFPDKCPDGSPLPFAAIEVQHPIDGSCGINGKPTSSANSRLQDSVKNNFCAPAGTPAAFTPQMLIDLQANTKVPAGQGKEPKDRAALQELGEGKLIRMKVFLIEAHHADLGSGESVNCNMPDAAGNDVHIAFGNAANTQECASITAEISPHYRPASWDEIGNFETYNTSTKKYSPNPALASRLQAHPYRITGQLFFDASHAPCPCGTTCSPSRSSVWEIHPVYKIEVCTGSSCDENTDSNWIAFDDWWKTLQPIQATKPPHTHSEHEPAPGKKKPQP